MPPIKKTKMLYTFATIFRLTFCPANRYAETESVPINDKPSPISDSFEIPMSPQAIRIEPKRATIKQNFLAESAQVRKVILPRVHNEILAIEKKFLVLFYGIVSVVKYIEEDSL